MLLNIDIAYEEAWNSVKKSITKASKVRSKCHRPLDLINTWNMDQNPRR